MLTQFLLYNIKIIHNQIYAIICLVEYRLQTLYAEKTYWSKRQDGKE